MQTKYQVNRNETTCYCDAEKYPHRLESTAACRDLYNSTNEDSTCANCSGSGEGQYDCTRCISCKGSGVTK